LTGVAKQGQPPTDPRKSAMSLRYLSLIVAVVLVAACSPITQENFAKLKAGMPRSEVEELLGKPGECAGALGMSSCTWGQKNSFISIQFAGDKVMMFSGQGLK
jgi:hypothetical protein